MPDIDDVCFHIDDSTFRKPVRLRNSKYGKWFISEDEYPLDVLPPFLSGGSILTHISVVRKLQIAFPFMKQIHLDDVYVSHRICCQFHFMIIKKLYNIWNINKVIIINEKYKMASPAA
jgi:hypothetical protein